MSSFFSTLYLGLFLPAVALLYWLTPQRHRWKLLLAASWFFFWSISGKLLVYLMLSTFSIHHFGLWMTSVLNERTGVLKEAEKSEKKAIKARYQSKLRALMAFFSLFSASFRTPVLSFRTEVIQRPK